MRAAKAVHDVFGIDARPHHDPELGELCADLRKFNGEGLLRGVELCGAFEQGSAFGVKRDEPGPAVRNGPVAGGIANGGHVSSPDTNESDLGEEVVRSGARTNKDEPTSAVRQLPRELRHNESFEESS